MWTLFWPAPIFLAVFILLIWIMQKAWSFKF
jgi:hypothetical protein